MLKYTVFVLVIAIALLNSTCNTQTSKTTLNQKSANYKLIAAKAIYTENDWGKYWIVPVTLINNSDEVRSYETWTCGWDEIYTIESNTFKRKYIPCEKNLATILGVGPHDSLKVLLPIEKIDKVNSNDIEYKIGFRVKFQFENFIIWSNTIKMKI